MARAVPRDRHRPKADGRPLAIDTILDSRPGPNGEPITAGTRFLDLVALGQPDTLAAEYCGITPTTIANTVKQGMAIAEQVENGRRTLATFTPNDQKRYHFFRDYARVQSNIAVQAAGALVRLLRDREIVTTQTLTRTYSDANGETVTETTKVEKVERVGPDPATVRWFHERRYPKHWAKDEQPVLLVPVSVEERKEGMVLDMRAYLAGLGERGQQAIEAQIVDEGVDSARAGDGGVL